MNQTLQTTIAKALDHQRQSITHLLQTEGLPTDDLPASLDTFYVALEDSEIVGAIGFERYDDCGLLRSMVVGKEFRNRQIAARLVQQVEDGAKEAGLCCLYLLTETAPQYFAKKGYETISRAAVPAPLQASSEFSHICPSSAIVMKKQLQ